ncbi:MAG: hypothetical protein KDK27_19620 [Leptospiraceae bacterium]|nr:hypothetical protein [Leptospiraceae bacterium]
MGHHVRRGHDQQVAPSVIHSAGKEEHGRYAAFNSDCDEERCELDYNRVSHRRHSLIGVLGSSSHGSVIAQRPLLFEQLYPYRQGSPGALPSQGHHGAGAFASKSKPESSAR